MEEKRKLEKLLLADVEKAIATYRSGRSTERAAQEERALTDAPPKAKSLLKAYVRAIKDRERVSDELEKLGYDVRSDYTNHYGYGLRTRTREPSATGERL